MEILTLIIVFFISFSMVFLLVPRFANKLTEKGFVVMDYYKPGKRLVPTNGGLIILFGVLSSLIIAQILINPIDRLLIFYFVVFTFAIFGLVDDLIDVGRALKIVFPFFLALPIALLNLDTSLWIGFTEIELGVFYTYLIAPIYVMVVTNLVNMHSGYNGLSSGLAFILFIFVGIGAYVQNGIESLIYLVPILGASLAFLYYNKYPSKIFEGNCGSLMLGSALGGLIVLNNMEVFGVIILIPHIINFLMYVVWKVRKVGEIKFGQLREDGTLKVPNPLTMKWILPYYHRVTEQQAILVLYLLTAVSGAFGLIIGV